MAIQFRLPEAVREQYGLDEWVVYDPAVMMLNDAIELEDLLGIDPYEVLERLSAKDGKHGDLKAWKFVIWKAVVRAGADVAYADFNLDLFALRVASTSGDDAGPKETSAEDPSIPASVPVESSDASAT